MTDWTRARNGTRRLVAGLLLALFVIATNSTTGFGKPSQRLSDAERDRLCAKAVSELESARELLKDYEARLATAREQIRVAGEKDAISAATIGALEGQVKIQKDLVANLESQVKTLTDDNVRVRGERDRALARNHLWGIFGAIAGAALTALALSAAGN